MSDLEESPKPNKLEIEPEPEHEPMNNIDKLTLELLINKSQYKKYVQKNDPAKYSENQAHLGKIEKYRYKIEHIFSSLLENPEQQITTDINQDFTHFVKTCIRYFELKEIENTAEDHNGDPIDDDDVLFGAIDYSMSPKSSFKKTKMENISYASTYMPKYTMDSFVRTKKS